MRNINKKTEIKSINRTKIKATIIKISKKKHK